MRREQWESFVRPFRCVSANGFLLLVGASLPRIENRSKITKLVLNNLSFELAPITAFDTIFAFPRGDKEPFDEFILIFLFRKQVMRCASWQDPNREKILLSWCDPHSGGRCPRQRDATMRQM